MSRSVYAILTLLSLLVPLASPAADSPRFSASLGIFIADRDTNTRIDASFTDTGTDVDLEDDLGFDKSDSVFRFDGYWRFAEKHRLDVSAFDLSRSATRLIDREITIGDTTYPIDSEVSGDLDLGIYKAAYTWMFLREGRNFLGLSAGLYIADVGAEFIGPLGNQRESRDITAPLPVIGLRGEYGLGERWTLRGSAELFAFDYNAFEGSLYDVFAGLDFAMTDTLSLGLGFNAVSADLSLDDSELTGSLDWSYSGAMTYLKADF
jgi:hypothetical protein